MACKSGHEHLVHLFIEKGIDVNEPIVWGATPLARACDEGHKKIAELLIEKGADANKSNRKNGPPFMWLLNGVMKRLSSCV